MKWIWMGLRFAALTMVISHWGALKNCHWSLVAAWLHGVIGMMGWRPCEAWTNKRLRL
jgi:hypothetical protein